MTTTCLKPKVDVESKSWYQIFSNYITEVQSLFFMKQLTTTCISTILHLRKIIPNNYFEPKNFEGMTLMFFKFGQGYKIVEQIEKWLKGAFEAIDKKYEIFKTDKKHSFEKLENHKLKSLMLDIKDAKSNSTLEVYTITFSYVDGNDDINLTLFMDKKKSLKESYCPAISDTESKTLKLLEMCYAVTTGLGPLPKQITLAIRLSYYKYTPENYQPNGYQALESPNLIFLTPARGIEIGITETKHHKFKLVGKSCFSDEFFKKLSDFQQKDEIKTKNKTSMENAKFNQKLPIPLINYSKNSKKGKKCKKVRCPCKATEKTKMMFSCYNCKYLVHSECYGVKEFDFSKKIRFFCNFCHKPEVNFICHDKVLLNLKSSNDQQKLSLLRKILTFCDVPLIKKISFKKMEKIAGKSCPSHILQTVFKKMIAIGVIIPQERKKFLKIDKIELKKNLIHYFYKSSYKSDHSQVKLVAKIREPLKRKDFDSLDVNFTMKKGKTDSNSDIIETQKNDDSFLQHSRDLFN